MALFLLEYRHDLAQARNNILRAVTLSGERAVYHAILGRIFRLEGQIEYARLAYQRARDLAPDNQNTQLMLDTLPPVEPALAKIAQANLSP